MTPEDFADLLTPEGRALLDSLRDYDPGQELAVATRLRRDHPAHLVSAALGQARLRQRAVAKFGAEDAFRMYFTPGGAEMATRASVAAYRAGRLADLGVRSVADLCCGIGGDALALARLGIRVLAVDRDPLTAAVARANAGALGLAELIEVREADVTAVDTTGYDAVFIDPARRGGRGRIFDPESYSPPLSWAVETARAARTAAIKIAPGIPHEAVPAGAEAEWISDHGDVKEAVLWFGLPRPAAPAEAWPATPLAEPTEGPATGPADASAAGTAAGPAAGAGAGAGSPDQAATGGAGRDGSGRSPGNGGRAGRGPAPQGSPPRGGGLTATAGEPAGGSAGAWAEDTAAGPAAGPHDQAATGGAGRDGSGRSPRGGGLPGAAGGRAGVAGVRATLLPGPRTLRSTGPLVDAPVGPVGRYLYEPDGAVIRAHLVAEVADRLGGRLIDPTIAYVTADELRATPYATAYEITDVLPFGLKKLKALLREREVGTLTVKKRGSAIEPEELRKKVKPQGPNAATVFLTRVAGAPSMLIGSPVSAP
ncbi:methyltransferase domain-containing protein [Streptomyces sp. NPDC046866]|uniref:THUMP-like domain-containing protein n=1 Tax=Streptomyces sp. NPDC046866 TaxID=3154921 RepID=UPI0034542E20